MPVDGLHIRHVGLQVFQLPTKQAFLQDTPYGCEMNDISETLDKSLKLFKKKMQELSFSLLCS